MKMMTTVVVVVMMIKVAAYIHWVICKHVVLQVTEKYYDHIPERIINVNGTPIMCDVPITTDRRAFSKPT